MSNDKSLEQTTAFCRLLGDATRVRLLALLEQEELTVAELTQLTQLAQPRVSNHLAKLRDVNIVVDRRAGASSFYRFNNVGLSSALSALWDALKAQLDDGLLEQDTKRLQQVIANRDGGGQTWADSVAGDMRRHYSPGRTWEATARGILSLLELGDVLDVASGDGVIADILARQSRSVTCVDLSEKVIQAGRQKADPRSKITFVEGDMHNLPVGDDSFDQVLLLHAMTYTDRPLLVAQEAFRALRSGGKVVVVTLAKHNHEQVVAAYNHATLGYSPQELRNKFQLAGFQIQFCEVTLREEKAPNFEVVTLLAQKP